MVKQQIIFDRKFKVEVLNLNVPDIVFTHLEEEMITSTLSDNKELLSKFFVILCFMFTFLHINLEIVYCEECYLKKIH
jgi:hypothetical protein